MHALLPSTLIHKDYWDGCWWCCCCCCCFRCAPVPGSMGVDPICWHSVGTQQYPQPGSGQRQRPWLLWPWLSSTSSCSSGSSSSLTSSSSSSSSSSSGSVLVLDDGMAGGEGDLARLREEEEAPRSCAITAAFRCTPSPHPDKEL